MRNFITNLVLLVAFTLTTSVAFANNTPMSSNNHIVVVNSNQLTWATAPTEEINFFLIQRSSDGVNFAPIAMIQKNKNNSFSYTDTNSLNQNWYYRVVKVDNDGIGSFMNPVFIPATAK